jgi:ubiquinone/menaquinone biosynthesis C-methylase UbiE
MVGDQQVPAAPERLTGEPRSSTGWWLDEIATAGRENLDASHVARYDAKEDAAAPAEVALLTEAGLSNESVVIDLGAGTGQFTVAAAAVCARVVAVDISPVMASYLRAKIGAARLTNVDVVQAGFLSYEHRDRPADVVYTRYALHHLPDFWKAIALTRLHRMIRPGGLLRLWDVVYGFDPAAAPDRIEAWCVTGSTDNDQTWNRAELEEHIRDEHSTFTWLLEPMIQRTGFHVEQAEYSHDGIFAKYLARAV